MTLFVGFFLSLFLSGPLFADEINQENLEKDLAAGKTGAGWKSLKQVLQDANKNESDPKVRLQNKRLIDRMVSRNQYPKIFSIQNYNNAHKNRLNGKDFVFADPAEKEVPWIRKEIVKERKGKRMKVARLDFDATYGKVIYEVTFQRKHLFKRNNALAIDMKSSVPIVQFILKTREKEYIFDYTGFDEGWQPILLPFEIFEEFPMNERNNITALQIVVNSDYLEEENYSGKIYLDNLALMEFKPEHLPEQIQETKRHHYEPEATLTERLYESREEAF